MQLAGLGWKISVYCSQLRFATGKIVAFFVRLLLTLAGRLNKLFARPCSF